MAVKEVLGKLAKGKAGVIGKVALGIEASKQLKKITKQVLGPTIGGYVAKSYPEHIGEGIENIKKGKVARGILQIIFNHPEWYLNYDGGKLINANYGINKSVKPVGFSDQGYSACVAVKLCTNLAIPQTKSNEWRQGIQILYNTLRSANSGSINYSIYDLERYVITVRAMHAAYYVLRRAFATIKNVSHYDATTPMSLFAATGLDYSTFMDNAAQLKMFGNKLSTMISRLYPLNLDLIKRTDWMFSNYFADSNDEKRTLYAFAFSDPQNYILPESVGNLQLQIGGHNLSATSTGMAFSSVQTSVNNLMNNAGKDNTMQVIAGDILRAFGQEAVMPEEIWDDSWEVPIVYDEAALTQIQNADLLNAVITINPVANDWAVMADAYDNAQPSNFPNTRKSQGIINMYKDDINAGDTLSATRLKLLTSYEKEAGATNGTETLVSCGTEFIQHVDYFVTSSGSTNFGGLIVVRNYGRTVSSVTSIAQMEYCRSQVDYSPNAFYGTVGTAEYAMLDVNNYALAGSDNIDAFHGYAVLSLLYVPHVSRLSKTELIK